MFTTSLAQQFLIGLAVLTSMGTLVQDTRINKALEVAVPLPAISVNVTSNLESLNSATQHTHVEQSSITQDLSGIPRIQARDDHRRYNLPKYSNRSSTPFGDSQLSWPNV
jgi:hypothetical protein